MYSKCHCYFTLRHFESCLLDWIWYLIYSIRHCYFSPNYYILFKYNTRVLHIIFHQSYYMWVRFSLILPWYCIIFHGISIAGVFFTERNFGLHLSLFVIKLHLDKIKFLQQFKELLHWSRQETFGSCFDWIVSILWQDATYIEKTETIQNTNTFLAV